LNAREKLLQENKFDPQQLLNRAKRRRNFSERFDHFSDVYVWVLAAVVALAYLFSAIFGLIFALLGQTVAHVQTPWTVWSLQELSPVLLMLSAICVLRLFLYLGPVGVNAAKADWWLPLPISTRPILGRSIRSALLTGLLTSSFVGVLWLIVMFGLVGAYEPLVALYALISFALSGVLLTSLAVVLQSYGLQPRAQRWLGRCIVAAIVVLAAFWFLLQVNIPWAISVVEGASSSVLRLSAWAPAAIGLLCLSVLSTWWAWKRSPRIGARDMRVAGEHQRLALGSAMQADTRGAVEPSSASIGRRRRRGNKLASRLPVAWRILVLRLLRGGRWHATLGYLVMVMAMVATVEQVANPLSALLFYLVLCLLLTINVAGTISPLISQPQLTQHLGQSAVKLQRTAVLFAVFYCVIALTTLTGGLALLGVVQLSNFWLWGAAVIVVSLGGAAASLGHAQRKERDWESLLGGSTSDTTVVMVLMNEASTLIPAVATYAPLFALVLSPETGIGWPLWGISVLFALRALRPFLGRAYAGLRG